MSTTYRLSPLLRARPDFLGVALSGDNFSIFHEMLLISDLSTIIKYNTKSLNNQMNKESIDSMNEIPLGDNNEQTHSCNGQDSEHLHNIDRYQPIAEHSKCDKTMTDENVKLVVDRLNEGAALVPYSHNSTTLELFEILKKLKIPFETEIYKSKETRSCVDANIFYCKNLFLKDRKGQYFLVICHEDLNMDLKQLRKALHAYRNFNFGTAEDMAYMLNTSPGGVTPFGLKDPNSVNVKMVIHKSLVNEDAWLMFHPFDKDLATKITLPSLMRFLKYFNHDVIFIK